jgi:hypothetical protein
VTLFQNYPKHKGLVEWLLPPKQEKKTEKLILIFFQLLREQKYSYNHNKKFIAKFYGIMFL